MIKRLIIIFGLNLICLTSIFAQQKDTLTLKPDTSKVKIPPLVFNKYQYINFINPDTITRNTFLWLPLKNIQNIFDYLPGYQLNYSDVGQLSDINYNQILSHHISLLRNGRPINDLISGQPDFNLLSRNEIYEIELSNGNSPFGSPNVINVIERQFFRMRPYTEIAFWQDRFENLYFDGNFHKNLLNNKFNFNFGITKHSYDGKYKNSYFDKWQGRFNLSYIGSDKVNAFLSVNYSHIQRGLNGGLDTSVDISNKDSLFSSDAKVRSETANEDKTRFDIDLGLLAAYGKNKNSFTKLQFFTSNLLNKFFGPFYNNSPDINVNRHRIDYGAILTQNISFPISKDLLVNSKSSGVYTYSLSDYYDHISSFKLHEDINFLYKGFNVNLSGGTTISLLDSSIFYNRYKAEVNYKLKLSDVNIIPSASYLYIEDPGYLKMRSLLASVKLSTSTSSLYVSMYENRYTPFAFSEDYYSDRGLNTILDLNLSKFNLFSKLDYYINQYDFIPKFLGNSSLSYRSYLFKNKLDLKIGFNVKYWSEYYTKRYSWNSGYYIPIPYNYSKTPANATLDLFLIGRIDKAVFGLTIENILNRAVYNTGLYPYQDRGGFLQTISRFNITWYFIN